MKHTDSGIGMTSRRTRERLVQALRDQGIHHEGVLQAMVDVPRHCFIEEALQTRAYDNIPLPIGANQTISQPYIVAKMTEALASGPLRRVLEIGTGSGYQAAILSQLANDVYTVERVESLYHRASQVLSELGYSNVHTRFGDGAQGWSVHAPFDGIMVTAAAAVIPEDLLKQLADGGRLICPVGPPGSQVLQMITRHGTQFHSLSMDPVRFVPFIEGTE